jgi:hypothetical protein
MVFVTRPYLLSGYLCLVGSPGGAWRSISGALGGHDAQVSDLGSGF